MSNCSCGGSCNCSPYISVNDLPKGEQVVTTIKREDIPKPPPKPQPVWPIVLIIYFILIIFWVLRDNSPGTPTAPVEPYPKPYPQPYPLCPNPSLPSCPN